MASTKLGDSGELIVRDRAPPVEIRGGAIIPRERGLFLAWGVAIVGTIVLVTALAIFWPESYRRIILFIPDGVQRTFELTVISIALGLVIGLIAGLGRISRIPIINTIASLYVEVIRGIPLLVQLFWIYYALAKFLVLGPYVSAIIGLAVCYGAYIGEIFRAGIQSIPKGQMEAARSLGMSGGQAMRHVILPQAIRVVLPPIGNEFIAMLKDSSLVSVLAISDLLRRGREFASRTFLYFETFTEVAMVYLLITLIFSRVVSYIEQGMSIGGEKEGRPSLIHRMAAYVTDFVLLYVIWMAINSLVGAISQAAGWTPTGEPGGIALTTWISLGIALVLFLVYLLIPWAFDGRTPGKAAVGLRIVRRDGRPPGFGRALLRILPLLLTLLVPAGWILAWGVFPLSAIVLVPAGWVIGSLLLSALVGIGLIGIALAFLQGTFLAVAGAGMADWAGGLVGRILDALPALSQEAVTAWSQIPWPAYLLLVLPLLGLIGFLWTRWDRYGQGWHDKLAGTYVVRD